MFNRFEGKGWKEGSTDEFFAYAPDRECCFFNLLQTPGGFEFELHASGERQIPQRMEGGDKFRGTYRMPYSVKRTAEFLQALTEEARTAHDPVPVIQSLLKDFRWLPGKDKGFGN